MESTSSDVPVPKIVKGVIERITYQNEENGYTVAKLLPDKRSDRGQDDSLITVIGTLSGAAVGEALEITGSGNTTPSTVGNLLFRITSRYCPLPRRVFANIWAVA